MIYSSRLEFLEFDSDNFNTAIYRECRICKRKYLYCYWDDEITSYIYLLKEQENKCSKCREKFKQVI